MSEWEFCAVLQYGDSGVTSSIISLLRRDSDKQLVVLERNDELSAYRVRTMQPNGGEDTIDYEQE